MASKLELDSYRLKDYKWYCRLQAESFMRTSLMALAALMLSACAPTLYVTYQSEPAGAQLYEGGRFWGYTPVTLQYPATGPMRQNGCMRLRQVSVRWASGAEASVPLITACAQNGYNQQFAFQRPADYPGRKEDAQFAASMMQYRAAAQQSQVQESAAMLQAFEAINNQLRREREAKPPTRCVSSVVGKIITTNCQ